MFAAGFLEGISNLKCLLNFEGALTAERIYQNYLNMVSFFFDNTSAIPQDLVQFYQQQDAWSRQQVVKHASSDHWLQVNLILHHFDGLVAGYQQSASNVILISNIY